jgi:four helix bundle protein
MRNFYDLRVWKVAHELTLAIYDATRDFPRQELYGLTSQIRRSSASIGANLAEGCGRQTGGEMTRFVQIAMGSASELEYHLLLARDLGHLDKDMHRRLQTQLTQVRRMLTAFLQTLTSGRQQDAKSQKPKAKSEVSPDF